MTGLREGFESERPFPLDPFQRRALDALDAGRSVLVAAPTGSGKTLVAEYAVARALAERGKVFYTTPLKALSNQKYGDFVRMHGAGRVGLLTGDNSINGDAPVVVMTTEVLRNMIYAASRALDGLRYVILDEVHYLQNPYRGAVWEEVIIHLPLAVDLVCLSATVSNAEEVADWLGTVRGATEAVIEESRPVELVHLYAVGDRGAERVHLLPTFLPSGTAGGPTEPRPNSEAARLDRRGARAPGPHGRRRSRLYTPRRTELAERLAEEGMLPAIHFIFSRAGCDDAVAACVHEGLRLTESSERAALRAIADAHTETLSDDDLEALDYDGWIAGLEAGVASHHAGLVPPMKEAVEEAFAAGLLKVVFATETLSLGINMPARSVVIEKLTKFTGEHHEALSPGEYTQLAGRAGRRGIDDVGYAVVCWSPFVTFDQVAALASRRTYALTSSFRPTYNMAANLVARYQAEQARHLLNLSFAQFHADKDVVGLERLLERTRSRLAAKRAEAEEGGGDLAGYRRLLGERDAARRGEATRRAGRFESLAPGDVLIVPRAGKVVVLKPDRGRGGARLLVLTEGRKVLRLAPDDLRGPPRRVGRIDLPRPFAPRSPRFQRAAADALARVRAGRGSDESDRDEDETGAGLDRSEDQLAAHPLAADPRLPARLRAATAADRLERETARLERRVAGRGDSLARQFDRVLEILEAWGYVDGWTLTDAGRLLTRLYAEGDLLIAEVVREGLLDGLEATDLAAVVSCCTFERRGADGGVPRAPARWPSRVVAARARAVENIWRDLELAERDARLPATRPPDPGFSAAIHSWVGGVALAEILEDEEMTGGDFVRNVKQVIDLLQQIGVVAPDPLTAATARQAADAARRGVVAASSLVSVPA